MWSYIETRRVLIHLEQVMRTIKKRLTRKIPSISAKQKNRMRFL